MDQLYFAFANSPTRPLPQLNWEAKQIELLLNPLEANGHFKVKYDESATLESVQTNLRLYQKDLVLFHFSGHAGPNEIQLLGDAAKSLGIIELLSQCPNLKLVFLNGCATVDQVKVLQELTKALVIATYREVGDEKTAKFAVYFYRSLSYFDTVEHAFEYAQACILMVDDRIEILRGLSKDALLERLGFNAWGLFDNHKSANGATWTFPNRYHDALPENYKPNERLIASLLQGLAPYVDAIKAFQDEEPDQNLPLKLKLILENLPHPLSAPMLSLFASDRGSPGEFYDQLGRGRLRQIFSVYLTSVELITIMALAELWDFLAKSELKCPPVLQNLIKKFLRKKQSFRLQFEHFALYQEVVAFISDKDQQFFIEELQALSETIKTNAGFQLGFEFFGYLESNLDKLSENVSKALCMEAERFLSMLMQSMGFIARYTIASIKNINVLIYRHQTKPTYKHSIVKLQQMFVGLSEEQETLVKVLSPSAVVLLHKERLEQLDAAKGVPQDILEGRVFLNLFPFILDQNAFDEKASIAKVHFFNSYLQIDSTESAAYTYRHIYMYNDQLLSTDTIPKKYKVIVNEFDSFAQLIFQQPMTTALYEQSI